ncbi:MAG: hypothetical protein HS116_12355 [Planctomycetes bacterium]|nr:hypothetical protein [Planctomycetota bacterium]
MSTPEALPAELSQAAFLTLLPELQSRAERMSKRLPRRLQRDAADDALAAMFLNHAQARRRGKSLSTSELGWAGAQHLRHRSLATRGNYPSRRQGDYVSLDAQDQPAPIAERLARAITTDEREDPAVRVQQRIDWRAFARTQPPRMRRILLDLAVGHQKCEIAARLGVSRGRLSQLLTVLAGEIAAFGHAEVPS